MRNVHPSSGPRPSDKWIPWYLALFFVVMVMALAPMAYLAVHTLPGVVTENSYEKGLAYNRQIAAGTKQNALGWKGVASVQIKDGAADVRYELRDAHDNPVEHATAHLWLVRPAQGGMDKDMEMIEQGPGTYLATVPSTAHGVWDVRVGVQREDAVFQTQQRVVIP